MINTSNDFLTLRRPKDYFWLISSEMSQSRYSRVDHQRWRWDRIFWGSPISNPNPDRKSPEKNPQKIPNFIPGIGDFWKSGDFHLGNSPNSGDRGFLRMGIFWGWGFFSWDANRCDIPPKRHLWLITKIWWRKNFYVRDYTVHKKQKTEAEKILQILKFTTMNN